MIKEEMCLYLLSATISSVIPSGHFHLSVKKTNPRIHLKATDFSAYHIASA
ncbi:hypothetical protein [Pseudomonas sp. W2-17]|uniref:hypothetical protein n=1 Tax=Pseudomonas sp. W2-17 TaxID=3058039 RepID=UPI0034E08B4F